MFGVLAFLIGWAWVYGDYWLPGRYTTAGGRTRIVAERDALVYTRLPPSGRLVQTRVPHWLTLPPLSVLPTISALRLRRGYASRRRARLGLCRRCGYDLRGSAAACLECGKPVPARRRAPATASAHSPAPPGRRLGRWAAASLVALVAVPLFIHPLRMTHADEPYFLRVFGIDTPKSRTPPWIVELGVVRLDLYLFTLLVLAGPPLAWGVHRVYELEREE